MFSDRSIALRAAGLTGDLDVRNGVYRQGIPPSSTRVLDLDLPG